MRQQIYFFRVASSLVPVFVSFTVNAILKILTIFLFKILCWQCWKTTAVYQRTIMLDEWREQVKPLLPLPIVSLVAVMVEQLRECCAEKDEKDLPVPRWRIDERNRIWASLTNREGRKAGLWEVSCVFLYLVL